jgi:amidophosphoribosyltransferase
MCGIAAIIDLEAKQDVVEHAVALGLGINRRGNTGAGMAFFRNRMIHIIKGNGLVPEIMTNERLVEENAHGTSAIVHTRYPTNGGSGDPALFHPLQFDGKFAIALNGNIPAYDAEEKLLRTNGYPPRHPGDTEIIGQMMLMVYKEGSRKKIQQMFRALGGLDGSYNLVALAASGSIAAVRDRRGFHPLSWARKGSLVAVASESSAIKKLWGRAKMHDLMPGSMLQATPGDDEVVVEELWSPEPSVCFFEYVYFADHRTIIDGTSVSNVRHKCGEILAEMDADRPSTDIVVAVPESAKIAASGYRDARHVRMVDALMANPDVGRTFIASANVEDKVARKYDVDPELVRGRSIILIDDSLVRGRTMRALVHQKLRAYDAAEVHLRLASPPIMSPCLYGMDFPTVSELLVREHHPHGPLRDGDILPDEVLQAVAKDIGVDSIKYLPVSAIPRALGRKKKHICMACVTGQCPTKHGQILTAQAEEAARTYRNSQI